MAVGRGLLARPRSLVLGVVVMCATMFAGAASAQAAHYSLGLTFEFHNGFPHTTEVKVVPEKTVCAKIHPSDPKHVGKTSRIDLGKVDIETGGDCFWSFSFASLKLENARTGSVLAALEAAQTGPRLFDVKCKPKSDANPKVKSCVGGNDPLAPRWYWRVYHQPS